MSVSKHIKFITIYQIKNKKKATLADALDATFCIYNASGFEIAVLHADQEFECLRQDLLGDDNGNSPALCSSEPT